MPVVGVQFRNIEARRFQETFNGQVRVDHNSNFQSVSADGEGIRVEFTFTTSYGAVGILKIEGTLAWKGDAGPVLEHWTSKRALPPEVAQEVHTGVLTACMPESVLLARSLRLPPPMPIPQVKIQQKGGGATAPVAHDGPDAA